MKPFAAIPKSPYIASAKSRRQNLISLYHNNINHGENVSSTLTSRLATLGYWSIRGRQTRLEHLANTLACSCSSLASPAPQDDGIRLLQAQTHLENSAINLCHSSCSLQSSGLLTSYLSTLSTWLTANPTEVVTLLLTNPDSISPSTFAQDFEGAGLTSLAYVPSQSTTARTEWPTLGEMVDSGKRLVVFMDYDADFSSVPYIIDGASLRSPSASLH